MRQFGPIEITHETRCAAPPDAAWSVLVAIARWPEWYPHVRTVRPVPTPEGAWPELSEGSTWEERVRRGPFTPRLRATVLERQEGEALTWEGSLLGVTGRHAWCVVPAGDGCILRDCYRFQGPGWRLAASRVLFAIFRLEAQGQRQIEAWARRADELDSPNNRLK